MVEYQCQEDRTCIVHSLPLCSSTSPTALSSRSAGVHAAARSTTIDRMWVVLLVLVLMNVEGGTNDVSLVRDAPGLA